MCPVFQADLYSQLEASLLAYQNVYKFFKIENYAI